MGRNDRYVRRNDYLFPSARLDELSMTTQHLSITATHRLTDSRQVTGEASDLRLADTVFFAIRGEHHDGHAFIGDLYRKGIRQFVVERAALTPDRRAELTQYPDATFIEVTSSLETLQKLASDHRRQFRIPVIGVT